MKDRFGKGKGPSREEIEAEAAAEVQRLTSRPRMDYSAGGGGMGGPGFGAGLGPKSPLEQMADEIQDRKRQRRRRGRASKEVERAPQQPNPMLITGSVGSALSFGGGAAPGARPSPPPNAAPSRRRTSAAANQFGDGDFSVASGDVGSTLHAGSSPGGRGSGGLAPEDAQPLQRRYTADRASGAPAPPTASPPGTPPPPKPSYRRPSQDVNQYDDDSDDDSDDDQWNSDQWDDELSFPGEEEDPGLTEMAIFDHAAQYGKRPEDLMMQRVDPMEAEMARDRAMQRFFDQKRASAPAQPVVPPRPSGGRVSRIEELRLARERREAERLAAELEEVSPIERARLKAAARQSPKAETDEPAADSQEPLTRIRRRALRDVSHGDEPDEEPDPADVDEPEVDEPDVDDRVQAVAAQEEEEDVDENSALVQARHRLEARLARQKRQADADGPNDTGLADDGPSPAPGSRGGRRIASRTGGGQASAGSASPRLGGALGRLVSQRAEEDDSSIEAEPAQAKPRSSSTRAATRAATKKASAKKAVAAKKAPATKPAAKSVATKRPATTRKAPAKKAVPAKEAASAPKAAPAKKAASPGRPVAKTASATKPAAKKAPAKKPVARKAVAKKVTKKAAAKKKGS